MRRTIAPWIVTLLVAIAMAAGGAFHGAARLSQQRGAGVVHEIVICAAGSGETVIAVDDRGNPVDPDAPCPSRPCPDCLPAATNALVAGPAVAVRIKPASARIRPVPAAIHADLFLTHPAARGPPSET